MRGNLGKYFYNYKPRFSCNLKQNIKIIGKEEYIAQNRKTFNKVIGKWKTSKKHLKHI